MVNMAAKTESAATDKPPAKKKEIVMRDGKCLTCGQVWTARTGGNKRPARCPVCHSRTVKWLDECTEDEKNIGVIGLRNAEPELIPEPVKANEEIPVGPEPEPEYIPPEPLAEKLKPSKPKTAPKPAKKPTPKQTPEPTASGLYQHEDYEEFEKEYQKKTGGINPKFFVFAFIGLILAGGIFFLYRKYKNSRPQSDSKDKETPAARPAFTPVRSSIGPLPPLYGGME